MERTRQVFNAKEGTIDTAAQPFLTPELFRQLPGAAAEIGAAVMKLRSGRP